MAETTQPTLKPTDVLSVKSRVSWAAIAAGAMIALAVYFLLTLLGVAVGLELAVREKAIDLPVGAALWAITTLLFSMFIGGWATSRLAVGETKLEAFLYGVILWGVLFVGLFWMVGQGVRVGFGAMVGVASGAVDVRARLDTIQRDPTSIPDQFAAVVNEPEATQSAEQLQNGKRLAIWYTLAGVVISMVAVILGSLAGSGDVPMPVPLGIRKAPSAPPRV